MRFAFETVVWGRRLDDVEFVLDLLSACGYQGVEFAQSPDEIRVRDPEHSEGSRPVKHIWELLDLLHSRNLELVSLAGGTLKQRTDFCQTVRPPYLYVEDFGPEEEAALSCNPPFTLGLHPHWFMKVQRIAQARKRIKEYREKFRTLHTKTSHFLLLPDTAHLKIVGDDPVQVLRKHKNRLAGVHLKDWTPYYGRYSHRYAQGFVTLGKGVVEVKKALAALEDINFTGWVVVEQDFADTTVAQSAVDCALWLAQAGKMMMPSQARIDAILAREVAAFREQQARSENRVELQFLKALLESTTHGPSSFSKAVTDALINLGGIDAAKLFSYLPKNDELHLISASGRKQFEWKDRLKVAESLCGRVTTDQQVTSFDLTRQDYASVFGDAKFLAMLDRKEMVSVPIPNPSNAHHLRYVLNIFPASSGYDLTHRDLTGLGRHLSRLADHVTDDECSSAAVDTSFNCGRSTKRREFLKEFVKLLQRRFHCEGVSVFLVNENEDRLELLEPEATTGVIWDPSLAPHERYYPKGFGVTGGVWASGEVRLLSNPGAEPDARSRCREIRVTQTQDECLLAPMARLGSKVVGVVRLANKKPVPGLNASTMFTDDDVAVLDSIIQAALPFLHQLTFQERQLSAISRMTHEFQVPVVAIRGAANMMQHFFNEKKIKPQDIFDEDYLGDVIEWSKLMGRLANNARVFSNRTTGLPITPSFTFPLRDIIAPSVAQVRMLLRERGFSRDSIRVLNFADVPRLWLDKNQFQQVFFNLLSNAIKYADSNNFMVEITGGKFGSSYVIWFADWGPGIERGMEELIFEPGYRGRDAMKKDVAGQGIGLFVVRSIVEAHGGTIKVVSNKKPLNFHISLPGSLRHTPPTTIV